MRTPPLTAAFQERSGIERRPPLTPAWPDCQLGALKYALVPPPVTQLPPPKIAHSFHSASVLLLDEVKLSGLSAVGARVQPSISWVPPTAVTSGLTAGNPTALVEIVPLNFLFLELPPL